MPETLVPKITEISITDNPTRTGATILFAITVTEVPLVPQPVYPFAGEIYAGEEAIWW